MQNGPHRRRHLYPARRERLDKIARSDFEQPKAGPEGVKGRMPGIISISISTYMDPSRFARHRFVRDKKKVAAIYPAC